MQTHENVLCSTDGKLNASKINQQNTSLNTIEVPGQPVTNEQLYAAILLSEEPDYYDPATYEGAEWICWIAAVPTEDSVQPSETLPYVQQSDNISSQALAYRAAPLESVGDASVSVSVQEGCKESNFTPPVGSFSADVSKADNESNYPFNASTKD
ncbi:uncharacterized protein MONOS_927 [Monocercomonoides exilis]|uniref:uncharacterized protein n=1 Tax=Monocercomonoides exilis TaxID=2049356 RepID=UPI00355A0C23|nr:hypothetical protein MONOS_927 [Monocercomonoides exilis]|eukprot:MONOS_927.1-p1 / transcript=MONOS_927.1 / gene=MONOS_927 / organism=Monocercomonoides_exilis_PA203 / gene_product=unspecified product / transcript_product=unspecified product / location=Mono_scaffold00015:158859-159676(+) / protein_length=155 / sequence_SO=supercontig / SO=protein_coding / is_pseudo=false